MKDRTIYVSERERTVTVRRKLIFSLFCVLRKGPYALTELLIVKISLKNDGQFFSVEKKKKSFFW